jgi:uncharacterized protein (DUF1800 family)
MEQRAAHALTRFGLGRRNGKSVPDQPLAWLAAQLAEPDPVQGRSGRPSSADALRAYREDRADRGAMAMRAPDMAAPMAGKRAMAGLDVKPAMGVRDQGPHRAADLARAELAACLQDAAGAAAPFRERLVWFWANHFTVSTRRGQVAALIGPYMREAIRPHVTGRFADMLLAVIRHPAMLIYLDNAVSVGPDSQAGLRRHSGLNENLARECLELHTVSPAAGYTQADVTAFAKVLTGWSVELQRDEPGFVFRPRAHEPGDKRVMGQVFPEGEEGGVQALTWLADHPWTHRHLATKLVRHFVADVPPPDAVRRIEGVLRDTRGNLLAASLELTRLPEAWTPLQKLRSPFEYVIAAVRALGQPPEWKPDLEGALSTLGQPVFAAPLPNGWPDTATDWAGDEALLRRVDWAWAVAGRVPSVEPALAADIALGELASPATLEQIRHAGSRREAVATLLASPEFLRR